MQTAAYLARTACLVALLFGAALPSRAQTPVPRGQSPDRIQALRAAQPEALEAIRNEVPGALVHRDASGAWVRYLSAGPGDALSKQRTAKPEEAALNFMSTQGSLFGLDDARAELSLQRKDEHAGKIFQRFRHVHEGVPILGAEFIVQSGASGDVQAVMAKPLPGCDLDTTPGVAAEEAAATAVAQLRKELSLTDLAASTPALWIYQPSLIGPGEGPTRLVWRMDVTSPSRLDVRHLVLVDARLNIVLLHFNQVDSIKNREIHDTACTATLPGPTVRTEGQAATGDNEQDLAYSLSGDTYDFYFTQFGRDSIDGAGLKLISTVDYDPDGGCNYPNAFWNGTQMVYGTGYATADDVVAHELSHGVTENESSLFYYYQSGAINEALSDIFGEFVDLTNGFGNDTAGVRWLMGEDLPIGAIRNMKNPPAFGDPDRMGSANWYCSHDQQGNAWDNGGVHINSGIANKLCYLLVDGDTFNGKTVTGMGIPTVAALFYEAQTNLMTSATDYLDFYSALTQAAINLGWNATQKANLQSACEAVEINQIAEPCDARDEAAFCTAGARTDVYYDNLEGTLNWTTQTLAGSNLWFTQSFYTTSGVRAFWGDTTSANATNATPDSSAIAMSTNVAVPAGAFLHFRHAYAFEDNNDGSPYYDGGVVEYSTNSGGSWNSAAALFVENGYNGTVSNAYSNPLGNQQAFVSESHGYISTRLDLSTLAGQNVRFRWRIGTDTSGGAYGWFIDDIRIYVCCSYAIAPTSANVGSAGGPGSLGVTAGSVCAWTATSNDAWITVTGGASGTGNGTVNYTVSANTGPARSGTITAAGQTYTVNQADGCTYAFVPSSISVGSGGGAGSASLTAGAGCAWTATSNDAWIVITGGASGAGNGSVSYTVAANAGPARSGTITAAGATFTVNQADGCSYGIAPSSTSVGAGGGAGALSVTAGGSCGWTAVSNDVWIVVTGGASGTGNGTVNYTVSANTGPARSGTITAAGATYTVNQADGCTYSIAPPSAALANLGGAGSVGVTAGAGCAWTAVSNDLWIVVTGGASGTGNGTVNYNVLANLGPPRSGTITVAGETHTVNQANGCTYGLSPASATPASAGGAGSFSVTAGIACGWTAASNDAWIVITGGASGIGNGTVNYTVASNTGPARNGTITAAGETYTINQADGCVFALTPSSASIGSAGGPGSLGVTSGTGCAWSAVSNDTWITVTGGASGTGNGPVNYTVSPTTGPARSGTITAAGETYTINQADGCIFALTPSSASVGSAGGPGSLGITSGTGCTWTAVSNDAWITVTGGASGTGNGTVNYTVSANTGPARSGTITAAGETYTINQSDGCVFAITPSSASVGSAGGPGSLGITSGTGCAWTAVSNDTWITVTGGASGTGNGPVNYTVSANTGPARSGTITAAGETYTINQSDGCVFAITPSSASVSSAGGPGSLGITSGTGCTWTAVSNDTWITVTGGASGTGNGTVNYTVTANTGPARSGTITAAGETHTINQADGCVFGITPSSANVGSAGGPGSLGITSGTGCAWTAASNDAWITVTGGSSGSGNGTVNYTVSANTGPARSGTITAAGETYTINQSNGCVFAITPLSASVSSAGGPGSLGVTSGTGCAWTTVSNDAWITVTGGASGSGNGPVNYTVSANTGPARSGTITAAGETYTVNQSYGCVFGIAPSSASVGSAGGPGSLSVTSGAGCAWTAVSNDSWIVVTSGASGSGNGPVNYTVTANTGPARSGTITAAGETYTINQFDGCVFGITPSSASVGSAGGPGSLGVTSGTGCAWSAVSNDPWIVITGGASGTGNGPVNYTVSANPGPARSGTITAAGETYTINQADGCVFGITPSSTSVGRLGGSGSVNVTAGAGCAWTAVSNDGWIVLTGGASGTGNGSVNYSVSANTGPARSGSITVAGETYTVDQATGLSDLSFVQEPPAVVEVPEGDALTLSVTTSGGMGSVHFQWYREDGTKVLVPVGSDASVLSIPGISPADAGVYYCYASDDLVTIQTGGTQLVLLHATPVDRVAYLLLPCLGILALWRLRRRGARRIQG